MDRSLSSFELPEKVSSEESDPGDALDVGEMDVDVLEQQDNIPLEPVINFDDNLPNTVSLLVDAASGTKVYLVGTAHFSRESQNDVAKVIQAVRPNAVMLELCGARTNILVLDEETVLREVKSFDFSKMLTNIRINGPINGIMYLLLLNMSAKITVQLGMAPGQEFRIACEEAKKIPGCTIHLGDRPISVTVKRALAFLSWWQACKLGWQLLTDNESVSVQDIEKCKNRDMLEQLTAELSCKYPKFRQVILDERDIYLTYSLQTIAQHLLRLGRAEPPRCIVGVVGIGHMDGIIRRWGEDQSPYIAEILSIPEPSKVSKALRLTFKLILLSGTCYLLYRVIPLPSTIRKTLRNALLLAHVKIRTVIQTPSSV